MKIPLKHLFKAQWKFPKQVDKWLKGQIAGYTLHVCCGSSDIGDVHVDTWIT